VLEYCRGGDLQKFIKDQPGGRLAEPVARHFMRHLASGLKFLNDRNLVHRDIKPQNLLLTEKSPRAVLKIADFGFARHLEGTSMADTLCGSPLYMAPEILGQNQYNAKADLWSVGAVLFEMVAGKPPFLAQNQVELLHVIKRPLQMPVGLELSKACLQLLQGLLKREPHERISFEDFFSHAFVDMMSDPPDSPTSGGSPSTPPSGSAIPVAEGPPSPSALLEDRDRDRRVGGQASRLMDMGTSADMHSPSRFGGHSSSSCANPCLSPPYAAPPPAPPRFLSSSPSTPQTQTPGHAERHRHRDLGMGMGSSDGESFSSAGSGRPSLPFRQQLVPSPRVNPFKPLAASPPGAAALGMVGSGTQGMRGAGGSAGRRAMPHAGTEMGPGGGGETGGSVESDDFVIVDSMSEPQSSSSVQSVHMQGTASTQSQPPALGALLHQTGGYGSSLRSTTSTLTASKSMDSVDGALRVLAYVESSCRRAVLIASLGDAKAIAGLSLRHGGLKRSVLDHPHFSVVSTMLGPVRAVGGDVEDRWATVSVEASVKVSGTLRNSKLCSSSWALKNGCG
jgi:serine/threonine-protein kinase ULK2